MVVPAVRAESDSHDADARLAGLLRGCDDVLGRLECLAVAEDHDGAIAAALRRDEQVRSLSDRARERAARLADDGWIEVVEKEIERGVVDRERREDVAAPREREQREAIARRRRAQAADLLLHLLESVRTLVGRHHRQRRVDREDDVDAFAANDGALDAPAWPGDRDTGERRGEREARRAPAGRDRGVRRHEPRGSSTAEPSRVEATATAPVAGDHERDDQRSAAAPRARAATDDRVTGFTRHAPWAASRRRTLRFFGRAATPPRARRRRCRAPRRRARARARPSWRGARTSRDPHRRARAPVDSPARGDCLAPRSAARSSSAPRARRECAARDTSRSTSTISATYRPRSPASTRPRRSTRSNSPSASANGSSDVALLALPAPAPPPPEQPDEADARRAQRAASTTMAVRTRRCARCGFGTRLVVSAGKHGLHVDRCSALSGMRRSRPSSANHDVLDPQRQVADVPRRHAPRRRDIERRRVGALALLPRIERLDGRAGIGAGGKLDGRAERRVDANR